MKAATSQLSMAPKWPIKGPWGRAGSVPRKVVGEIWGQGGAQANSIYRHSIFGYQAVKTGCAFQG